jgi:hypothetical protein
MTWRKEVIDVDRLTFRCWCFVRRIELDDDGLRLRSGRVLLLPPLKHALADEDHPALGATEDVKFAARYAVFQILDGQAADGGEFAE